MGSPATVVVVGVGNRGREAYGSYILEHPGEIKAVAVAEPDKDKRNLFAKEHNILEDKQFVSWEEILNQPRLADGIIIATMDDMHVEPALKAMEKGYKILLEKPIAIDWHGVSKIVDKARETDSKILVAHVLRHTNFFRKIKELLAKKVIGKIRFVDYIENIGFFHFAHSYVRGNWNNSNFTAPIILAKCCHDMDLIYWLLGKKCLELSSHASLEFFTAENKPEGASDRCLSCMVENDCPYSARKIYRDTGWPTSVITTDLTYKGIYKALKEGPYGRCVFSCDNNVPEVQTIRMTCEDNIEVNFALTAFSNDKTRTIKIFGTKGEIRADFDQGIIDIYSFNKSHYRIKVQRENGGHGGGDTGLMNQFARLLKGEVESDEMTSIDSHLESHIMAFSAEESRHKGTVINLDNWRI